MGEDNDDNCEFLGTKRSLQFVLTSAFAPAILVSIGSIILEIGVLEAPATLIAVVGWVGAPFYSFTWSSWFVRSTGWKFSSKILLVLPIGFALWWVNYLISMGACIAIDPPLSVELSK